MTLSSDAMANILECARWAPSGDNTQPWRFEVLDERRVWVRASDTRTHCVYDLDGHSSQLAHGALIESIVIAASVHGLRAEIQSHQATPDVSPDHLIEFVEDPAILPDSLLPYIPKRSVQRRPLMRRSLTAAHKLALSQAIGSDYEVIWFEGTARTSFAKLMFANAKLRLTLPEAYLVHRDIIEWDAKFSNDRVPDRALGLDAATLKLMRWVMASWQRVQFFNTYLMGHLVPRLEMDWLPSLMCGAHFALIAKAPPRDAADYVKGGRALQRFWLTATQLGIQLQPELTPLVFDRYLRRGLSFSKNSDATVRAERLSARLYCLLTRSGAEHSVFLGRLGYGPEAGSRSLRLALGQLKHNPG